MPRLSLRETKACCQRGQYEVSPALRCLASKPCSTLARLPDAVLAVVSRFLSLAPEIKLLLELVEEGRVPNPLLVEMARMSCSARRLYWNRNKGRFMCTTKKCHRHHCRWRRQRQQCVTAWDHYTRSSVLQRFFKVRGVPPGGWGARVVRAPGKPPVPYVLTVLERIQDAIK